MNKDDQDKEDETLHPWIEPDLEARLTALVLGEASDFEREELERLVAERPELGLYRKRLERVHELLREVKEGEGAGEVSEWALSPERRRAVQEKIGGAVDGAGEKGSPRGNRKAAGRAAGAGKSRMRPLLQFAAALVFVGIVLGLMFPASVGRRISEAEAWSFRLAEEEAAGGAASEVPAPKIEAGLALGADGDLVVRRDPDAPGRVTVRAIDDGEVALPEQPSTRPASPSDALFPRNKSLAIAAGPERAGASESEVLAEGLETRNAESGERGLSASTGGGLSSSGTLKGTLEGMPYDDKAHNQTRSRMMREVAEGWESPVAAPSESADAELSAPFANQPDEGNAHSTSPRRGHGQVTPVREAQEYAAIGHGGTTRDEVRRREEKLKSIIIPSVEFADTPLRDALEFLRQRSVELDTAEPDPSRRGINIVLDAGMMGESARAPAAPAADAGDGFGFSGGGGDVGDTRVTLRLSNVPLAEALRYTTSLAQLKYKVEPHAVLVVPLSTPDSDLYTNVYSVPPTFLAATEGAAGGGGAADSFADPFADPVSVGGGVSARRRTAKDALESAGITFPPGASVIYNPETSQLIVRNTPDQMELVEAYIEPIGSGEPESDQARVLGIDPGDEEIDRVGVPSRSEAAPDPIAGSTRASGREIGGGRIRVGGGVPGEPGPITQTADEADMAKTAESLAKEEWRHNPETADDSVQDILALTPQIGERELTERLSEVVPEIVGGGSASRTRSGEAAIVGEFDGFINRSESVRSQDQSSRGKESMVLSSLDVSDRRFLFPSQDDIALRRPLPPTLDETLASEEPFSTFSLHVGDVSFRLAREALAEGRWPEAKRIRIEEFVNAFDYGDPMPGTGERVACRIDQAAHPFLQQRNLVRIAMRTAEAGRAGDVPLRLTVLLDTSGSMERPDRSATVRQAFATLAEQLRESDRITLVGFARRPRLVADAVPGDRAGELTETVSVLPSEGGTNLEAALQLGFEKAQEHWLDGAQNRIVLLTDGAANLGDAGAESLGALVAGMREAGFSFDAAGVGAEGLNDEILEALARKGDGRYYLLNRPEDAGEEFAERIAGALRPAAENVKVQVEFNPGRIGAYRLLGFEKHRLEREDFRDDSVDAAEMAAAEAGVAVYQVEARAEGEGDLGAVSVRFRDLESGRMVERRWPIPYLPAVPRPEQADPAIQLGTLASQFAAKLAGGPLGDLVDLAELARLAAALPERERQQEQVRELIEMIEQARALEGEG